MISLDWCVGNGPNSVPSMKYGTPIRRTLRGDRLLSPRSRRRGQAGKTPSAVAACFCSADGVVVLYDWHVAICPWPKGGTLLAKPRTLVVSPVLTLEYVRW